MVAAAKLTKPGLHADGAGLYLHVGRGGTKSWVLRYSIYGRTREMGLGSLTAVGLADDARKLPAQGGSWPTASTQSMPATVSAHREGPPPPRR